MSQAPATQNTPAATPLPTPDPGLGLFETLLVLDGQPVALASHLERLAASLAELFEAPLPEGLAARAIEASRGLELGRMRIDILPPTAVAAGRNEAGAATLRTRTVDRADFFPGRERGATLHSRRCDGGLGRHKWADRRPLGEAPGGPVSLLLDGDEVLEAGRANVFAAYGQVLVTPRADGRILPGTARAAAIEIARSNGVAVEERALRRDELFAADEVFLTGSVRGAEPARSLDGEELPTGEALSRFLGDRLRQRWLRADRSAAIANGG